MVTAFIGIGSNIAPERNVPQALALLGEAVRVRRVSTFYRTKPLGRPDQPPFYNGVAQVDTELPPRELKFQVLREVEKRLGRVRTTDTHAARTIDLDVLLYGELVLTTEELRVPDPDVYQRPFIAVPLLELAPDLVMPESGEPLRGIVAGMTTEDLEPLPEFTGRLQTWEDST